MQLSIDIPNENIANKIVKILEAFKDDGVEILAYSKDEQKEDLINNKWDKEFAKKHWKEIILSSQSSDVDDDERLYKAATRFYNDKYSN